MGLFSRFRRKGASSQTSENHVSAPPSGWPKQGTAPTEKASPWLPGDPRGQATTIASPSTPGQRPAEAKDDDLQNEARLYRAGFEAARRGEREEALRYLERVVAAHPDFERDKNESSWPLALSLESLARLAQKAPAAAAIRRYQSAEVYGRLAKEHAAKGDQSGAKMAQAAADKAFEDAAELSEFGVKVEDGSKSFFADMQRIYRNIPRS